MTNAQASLGDVIPDFVIKFHKSHGIGYRGTGFANTFRNDFLLHAKVLGESEVSLGFLDGIEVLTLNILDQCHFEHFLVSSFTDNNRNFC